METVCALIVHCDGGVGDGARVEHTLLALCMRTQHTVCHVCAVRSCWLYVWHTMCIACICRAYTLLMDPHVHCIYPKNPKSLNAVPHRGG